MSADDVTAALAALSTSDSPSLSSMAARVRDASKIIVMAGAGISVSAGIPDFRTPGTGLYDNLQKYDLPEPSAVFSIDFFKENPKPFYTLARELYPGQYLPTPTHYFIKLLADKGKLLRCFTQNIDSLETTAGLDPELVVAAHGNFDTARCISTGAEVPSAEVREGIFGGEAGWRAMNEKYGGLVKPDIVFFGESLPQRFFERAAADFPVCDLLIVMGTSLVVQPFASLIDEVGDGVPRLLINREKVGEASPVPQAVLERLDALKGMVLAGKISQTEVDAFSDRISDQFGGGGFQFDGNGRDVAELADCDDGVTQLSSMLGWTPELDALVAQGRKNFDDGLLGSDAAGEQSDRKLVATPQTAAKSGAGDHEALSAQKPVVEPPMSASGSSVASTKLEADNQPESREGFEGDSLVPPTAADGSVLPPHVIGSHVSGLWTGDSDRGEIVWALSLLGTSGAVKVFGCECHPDPIDGTPDRYSTITGSWRPTVKGQLVELTVTPEPDESGHNTGEGPIRYSGYLATALDGNPVLAGIWSAASGSSGKFHVQLEPQTDADQAGLWVGEAKPEVKFADVATNPVKWVLCRQRQPRGSGPLIFGAGYFDDSGDIPGTPVLFYTLRGSRDTLDFEKVYSAPVPRALTVAYAGVTLTIGADGQPVLSGSWTNVLEGTAGLFGARMEELQGAGEAIDQTAGLSPINEVY